MRAVHVSLRRIGNSLGVVIPKPVLAQLGLDTTSGVEMTIEDGALVLRRPMSAARIGWAEAARSIVEAGGDELVMGEFGNAGDSECLVIRGAIWPVDPDRTPGSEIRKTRPCVVVVPVRARSSAHGTCRSHDHGGARGAVSGRRHAWWQKGLILHDQIRAVDKTWLAKKLGVVSSKTLTSTLQTLQEVFAE